MKKTAKGEVLATGYSPSINELPYVFGYAPDEKHILVYVNKKDGYREMIEVKIIRSKEKKHG